MNLLFYSTTCKYCDSVLLSLQKEDLLKYFHLMCVDNPEVFNQVTGRIKSVPSMTLVGCETILDTVQIFKWIEAQKFISNNRNATSNMDPQPKNPKDPFASQPNQVSSNMNKLNNLRNKLCTPQQQNNNTNKDLTPYDLYSKGGLQLTSIDHEDPILSGNTYSNINENTCNTIFTGEEIALSSKRHKKLVSRYEDARKLQDIERNMTYKKPKQDIDFSKTKAAETENLVHKGYYTEIVKDLTKSSR
jgi:hypothetical protein